MNIKTKNSDIKIALIYLKKICILENDFLYKKRK